MLSLFIPVLYPWIGPYSVALIALLVLASAVTGALVAAKAHGSFGCVNGDIMGATNELSKPAVLIVGMLGVMLFLSM